MKFYDRLKFIAATATSAATITPSAAVPYFRTLVQAIADGAFAVGDTGLCFTTVDETGVKETSLYKLDGTTSAPILMRTEVQSSTAGGTTAATFAGSVLTVTNGMSSKQASTLVTAKADTTTNVIEIFDRDGYGMFVSSPNAPVNNDGRRNGVVWYQASVVGGAVLQYVKIAGVYQTVANPSVAIANPVAPVITSAPAVVGTPIVGVPLSITAGSFTGATSVVRSIFVAGTLVSGSAVSATYTPVAADQGKIFTVDEAATNSTGTTHNISANSAACAAALRNIVDRVYINQMKRTVASMGGSSTHTFVSATNLVEVDFWNGYVNGYANSGATYLDTGSGGPAAFSCQMQVGSTFYPLLAADGTLVANAADNARVTMTAKLPVTLAAGQAVKFHSYMKALGSGGCVSAGTATGMPNSGSTTTVSNPTLDICRQGTVTDATATGAWSNNGTDITGDRIGPVAIRGISTRPSVLILGTSIDHGEGGYQSSVYNSGLICAQLAAGNIGFTDAGIRADALYRFFVANANPVRVAMGNHPGITTIYIGGSVNDITASKSSNTIWGYMQQVAALFPGKNIVVGTLTPISYLQSDQSQTPTAFKGSWIDLNNKIRNNTFGWKVIDFATLLCPDGQPDACIWRDWSLTVDGTHPNNAGYDYVRASGIVDVTKFL